MKHQNNPSPTTNGDFAIEVGQCFRHGPVVFRIVERLGPNLRVEHTKSLELRRLSIAELLRGILAGEIFPCSGEEVIRSLSGDPFVEDDEAKIVDGGIPMMSEAARSAGIRICRYINALRSLGYTSLRPTPLLKLEFERLKLRNEDKKPLALSTVYQKSLMVDRFGGDWRAAFPHYSERGGRGKARLPVETLAHLNQLVESLKADRDAKIRFSSVESELKGRLIDVHGIQKAVLLMPSRSTIERHIKREFSAHELYRRIYGMRQANKKFRDWYPRDTATAPLEVVEFDDKDTRVFGIDERTGLPAGRIYLTSGVDQSTTVPIGFSISDKPRNTWSAINAFINAVLPKDVTHQDWTGVSSEVPYMGKMAIAVFDNALYNHSKALEAVTLDVANAITAWAKPYTPTEKSAVEDFNGRMVCEFLSTLPGFAGPKDSREQLSKGLIAANLSVTEFKRCFLKWVYDDHCNNSRDGGMTPRQRWERGMLGRQPRVPADINRIRMAAMLPHRLRLRPEQISFCGLIYQCPRLQVMKRRLGHNAEVNIRYHPERADRIFVQDPTDNNWFVVPSVSPEYTTNITFAQHKLIRKMARENKLRNPSIPELVCYRTELKNLVEQCRWSTKLRERKFANRHGNLSDAEMVAKPESRIIVTTELEYQVDEIQHVEMEAGDEGWDFPFDL